MLTLFATKGSIGLASALMLEEIKADYVLNQLDFSKNEQSSEKYLKINPKARVPALVTDQGILTETGAILEYVAADMMPSDPFEAAKIRSIVHYLASTMHVNHAHNKRGHRWSDDPAAKANMTANVPRTMRQSCAFMESQIVGPYIFGTKITIADPHFFAICQWLEGDGVILADFPKITDFMMAYEERDATQAARSKGLL